LPILQQNQISILQTDKTISEQWQQEKEELMLSQKAETKYKSNSLVLYFTRPQDKLIFLYDYCFTHGCLDLANPRLFEKSYMNYWVSNA